MSTTSPDSLAVRWHILQTSESVEWKLWVELWAPGKTDKATADPPFRGMDSNPWLIDCSEFWALILSCSAGGVCWSLIFVLRSWSDRPVELKIVKMLPLFLLVGRRLDADLLHCPWCFAGRIALLQLVLDCEIKSTSKSYTYCRLLYL